MAKVYRDSEELQVCVDNVFAEMFKLLESLVTQMTEKLSSENMVHVAFTEPTC